MRAAVLNAAADDRNYPTGRPGEVISALKFVQTRKVDIHRSIHVNTLVLVGCTSDAEETCRAERAFSLLRRPSTDFLKLSGRRSLGALYDGCTPVPRLTSIPFFD